MSAVGASPAQPLNISQTEQIPFWRLVSVELRKSYDTRAGFWLLFAIGAVVAIAEVVVTIVILVQDETVALGDFTGVAAFLTSFLLPVLGIMLVTSEWSQRSAMVTFALEPRRPHVVLAKLVVGVLLTLVTVVVAIAIGLVCTSVCEIAQGPLTSWELGFKDMTAFIVTQTLAMLGGFALAALLLNTPAAIVLFFVYKWVLPGLFALGSAFLGWFESVAQWLDFQLAQEGIWEWDLSGSDWAHLIVSGLIWLALPLALGLMRIMRAELK